MAGDGLRERNRARRRQMILRSAYELFADRGYEATTIADIASAAEVSPRTVTLYFPSKLELALTRSDAFADRLGAALRERKERRDVFDVLGHWLHNEITHLDNIDDLARRMFDANPQLRAAAGARLMGVVQEATRILVEEKRIAPGDFGLRMVAAATAGVIGELIRSAEESDIAAAMEILRAATDTIAPGGRPAN